MEFIKDEREDFRIEETSSLKQEETEEQSEMLFIKEESEDISTEEMFGMKDTEQQTGWFQSQSWTHSFGPYSDVQLYSNVWFFYECHY